MQHNIDYEECKLTTEFKLNAVRAVTRSYLGFMRAYDMDMSTDKSLQAVMQAHCIENFIFYPMQRRGQIWALIAKDAAGQFHDSVIDKNKGFYAMFWNKERINSSKTQPPQVTKDPVYHER